MAVLAPGRRRAPAARSQAAHHPRADAVTAGRPPAARPHRRSPWFERNRAACGPPASFSEAYDLTQHQMRGNLPQAFVHALLLESAVRLVGPDSGGSGHTRSAATGFDSSDREQVPPDRPHNLWEPRDGGGQQGDDQGARGTFDARSHDADPQQWCSRHPGLTTGAVLATTGVLAAASRWRRR